MLTDLTMALCYYSQWKPSQDVFYLLKLSTQALRSISLSLYIVYLIIGRTTGW